MMNNPILRRIAEAAELDVRAVYRDEDTDLIDQAFNKWRPIDSDVFITWRGWGS